MRQLAYILSVKPMKGSKLFRYRKIIIRLSLAAGGIYLALRYSEECRAGIENGIQFCLEVLIPSLFFFMIVAAYLVQSGAAVQLSRPLRGVSRVLFRLPAAASAAILLSLLGGYPVGASCAAMMQKNRQLSTTEAAKTVYIAVAAGPGFLVNYVGGALLGNPAAGYALLTAQVIAVLLTGILVGHTVKSVPLPHSAAVVPSQGNLLVNAVRSASGAALGMCGMVVLFCALSEVIDAVLPNQAICDIASAVTEITGGTLRTCGKHPLYVTAFFIGFGGLSVHFQIFSAAEELPINKALFFLFRIFEGIFMMAAAYSYLMIVPVTTAVFSTAATPPAAAQSASAAGSAALVMCAALFIGSISKEHNKQSRKEGLYFSN